jgi:hypothetical protein
MPIHKTNDKMNPWAKREKTPEKTVKLFNLGG